MKKDFNSELKNDYYKLVATAMISSGKPLDLAKKQQTLLETLDRMVPYGHCYFVYNILKKSIERRGGIRQVFGFDEAVYSMDNYLDSLHPALKSVQGVYSTGFITALSRLPELNMLDIETTNFRYIQTIKHQNGSNLFVRRTLIPFNYTADNRLLAWVNLFTSINDYQLPFKFVGCSFDTEYGDQTFYKTHVQEVINKELTRQRKMEILKQIFDAGWHKQEHVVHQIIKILETYQTHPMKSGVREKEIADATGFKLFDVGNRRRQIVKIMQNRYEMNRLTTPQEVSDFFAEMGLLPI